MKVRAALILALFAFVLAALTPAAAHGGKTNKLGCHKQRGITHCHEIPTNKKKKKKAAKKKRRAALPHSTRVILSGGGTRALPGSPGSPPLAFWGGRARETVAKDLGV